MKAIPVVLALLASMVIADSDILYEEELDQLGDLITNEGPEVVIAYIQTYNLQDRIYLYSMTRKLYVYNDFPGRSYDDLITVIDYAIQDILASARLSDDTLVRIELLDRANILSFNLSADLAECWPGDTLTRYPRHFERGLSAALQCADWRHYLEKDEHAFFQAYWAAGMHQLSLERPEEALYNLVRSMNYAEQITVDAGRPLGFHSGAGFELLLAHGYFGLGLLEASGSSEHYDRTIELLEEGIEEYEEFAEDYSFCIDQLEWARMQLESR